MASRLPSAQTHGNCGTCSLPNYWCTECFDLTPPTCREAHYRQLLVAIGVDCHQVSGLCVQNVPPDTQTISDNWETSAPFSQKLDVNASLLCVTLAADSTQPKFQELSYEQRMRSSLSNRKWLYMLHLLSWVRSYGNHSSTGMEVCTVSMFLRDRQSCQSPTNHS